MNVCSARFAVRAVTILIAAVLLCVDSWPSVADDESAAPFVVVLGIAQDGGVPHAGCKKACCAAAWNDSRRRRMVSCIAVVDPASRQRWLFDCTPDFPDQLNLLDEVTAQRKPIANRGRSGLNRGRSGLDGIFLTHAHVGHYAGLMHLGREVLGSRNVSVYAMPRMRTFLRENGPWSQLITLNNIEVRAIEDGTTVKLNERISVTPFLVPHRDEFSETVGYRITGPSRSVAFIPDIDKWARWTTPVEDLVSSVDRAYLDGTFFDNSELPGRDMSQIPHPFIVESIARFAELPATDRAKVRFIHLNHSNPALDSESAAARVVKQSDCAIAVPRETFRLTEVP